MKFDIGQTVTLTSRMHPEQSGQYEVEACEPPAPHVRLERTGELSQQACYQLRGLPGWWAESALS